MKTVQCNLNCNNGGYCSLYPFEPTATTAATPVDGSLRQICVCPLGWTGITCLEPTDELEICHHHDGTHVCRNGGLCRPVVQNNLDSAAASASSEEGGANGWRCDCEIAEQVNAFAGAMCRRPATEYCSAGGSSFCTNGGSCVNNLVQSDFYQTDSGKCICPPEFDGPHCEFLKALMKENTFHVVVTSEGGNPDSRGSEDHPSTGIATGISALFLALVALLAIRQKRRNTGVDDLSVLNHGDHFSLSYSGYGGNSFDNQGSRAVDGDEDFVLQEVSLT